MANITYRLPSENTTSSTVSTFPPRPVPLGDRNEQSPRHPVNEAKAIPVAASAASLFLVLAAIIVWFFLVRKQLRKKERQQYRFGSRRSNGSDGSLKWKKGSFIDSYNRHESIRSTRVSSHGSPNGTPISHRRSTWSPKGQRHSKCCGAQGICSCKMNGGVTKTTTSSPEGTGSICTGSSPFCPHSTKMNLLAEIHNRQSSASLELHDFSLVHELCSCQRGKKKRSNTGDALTLSEKPKRKKFKVDNFVRKSAALDHSNTPCTCKYKHNHYQKPTSIALTDYNKNDVLSYSAPILFKKQMSPKAEDV